jgi:hypothetical protein
MQRDVGAYSEYILAFSYQEMAANGRLGEESLLGSTSLSKQDIFN